MPECNVVLAQCVVYLAKAKKSVTVYNALTRAMETVAAMPNFEVPSHLRNAPTRLMKEIGYGRGYIYTPNDPQAVQQFMPREFQGLILYDENKKIESFEC